MTVMHSACSKILYSLSLVVSVLLIVGRTFTIKDLRQCGFASINDVDDIMSELSKSLIINNITLIASFCPIL